MRLPNRLLQPATDRLEPSFSTIPLRIQDARPTPQTHREPYATHLYPPLDPLCLNLDGLQRLVSLGVVAFAKIPLTADY